MKIVYKLMSDPRFKSWRLPAPLEQDLNRTKRDDWSAVSLEAVNAHLPSADFAGVEGLEGCLVVPREPDMKTGFDWHTFSTGDRLPLCGDADNYQLFRPTVRSMIDTQNSVGLDDAEPEKYAFHGGRLSHLIFRSIPRISEIFAYEDTSWAGEIVDLDDNVNMDLLTWIRIAEITGLRFERIWQS